MRNQADAKAAAQTLANREGVDVYLIKVRTGYQLFLSGDPAFDRHRPANYLVIKPLRGEG